jgi:hypothetical protein
VRYLDAWERSKTTSGYKVVEREEEISPDLPDLWLVKSRSLWTIPAKRLGGAIRPVTGRF